MQTTIEKPNNKVDYPITNSIQSKQSIINQIATGQTFTSIAREFDVNRHTISKISKANKEAVETAKQLLIEKHAPVYIKRTLLENQKALTIAEKTNIPSQEEEIFLARQDKKGDRIMQSVGILQSHTNLTNFGNIQVNQDHRTQVSNVIAQRIGSSVLDELATLNTEDIS